ncbi:MAG: hypothetical protein K2X35_24555 [Bryobacteraceae bacterium]|nr:hypothetical protein [Bryobacteraceae bacterium]
MKRRIQRGAAVLGLALALIGVQAAFAGHYLPRPVCRFIALYDRTADAQVSLWERLMYMIVLSQAEASTQESN